MSVRQRKPGKSDWVYGFIILWTPFMNGGWLFWISNSSFQA
jgi:hypothetical protein